MTNEEAANIFHELALKASGATQSFQVSTEIPPEKVISDHALALGRQLRRPEQVRSVIHASWAALILRKNHPLLEGWLKEHGREIVYLFIKNGF